jgi:hypothetical protein
MINADSIKIKTKVLTVNMTTLTTVLGGNYARPRGTSCNMKRIREGQTPAPEKLGASGSGDQQNTRNPAKRQKSSHACSSCRRSKTRCELLDTATGSLPFKCHRCKVLNLQCSFESSGILASKNSPATPYTAPPSYRQSPEGLESPFSNRSDPGTTMPVSSWVTRRIAEFCDIQSTPMLALQEFARRCPADYEDPLADAPHTPFDVSMSDILPEAQRQCLLDMYITSF